MPVYWARRKRGLGEAEIPPRLGVPKAGGKPSAFNGVGWRGLGMSKGFEGEDIVVDDCEQVRPDDGCPQGIPSGTPTLG